MKQFDPIFFTPPSGDTKKPRRLYKGGGDDDGGAAERKAEEDARIAAAIKQLNEVFGIVDVVPEAVDKNKLYRKERLVNNGATGGNENLQKREALYSKIGTDATNVAMTDLNKERGVTERELGFSLARNGLSGGSRDIDANRDVLDTYQQGVLKASNLGAQTANRARLSDEKTRVNLINSIQAGLTSGNAIQQAYAGMSNNAAAAQDEANAASLTGFFDVLRNQQDRNQYQAGVNNVQQQTTAQPYKTSKASYGGTVRSV